MPEAVKTFAEGNEGRWARFYRDHTPFLENLVASKFPHAHEDADEIVSDTLIDIAKMMPTYRYDKAKRRFPLAPRQNCAKQGH